MQGRSRVPRRDGLELVDRLVEPVADVGPAESRVRGVIVAAAHQWMSRAPQEASRPVGRSLGLDSSHRFIWETCGDGTTKGPKAI